jgi:EAL domain-containing protein (putative c-di-GMP-specific phosphodiesterase class I)
LGRQLRLVYQPVVDSDTGAPLAYEALVRWSPDGVQMLPPSEFINLAEATGRI